MIFTLSEFITSSAQGIGQIGLTLILYYLAALFLAQAIPCRLTGSPPIFSFRTFHPGKNWRIIKQVLNDLPSPPVFMVLLICTGSCSVFTIPWFSGWMLWSGQNSFWNAALFILLLPFFLLLTGIYDENEAFYGLSETAIQCLVPSLSCLFTLILVVIWLKADTFSAINDQQRTTGLFGLPGWSMFRSPWFFFLILLFIDELSLIVQRLFPDRHLFESQPLIGFENRLRPVDRWAWRILKSFMLIHLASLGAVLLAGGWNAASVPGAFFSGYRFAFIWMLGKTSGILFISILAAKYRRNRSSAEINRLIVRIAIPIKIFILIILIKG